MSSTPDVSPSNENVAAKKTRRNFNAGKSVTHNSSTKVIINYVHLNNYFQLSLTLQREQNMILMLYYLKLRIKKNLPYKFRIEFFVRANFSTRLLKMSDILDTINEYTFDPFTSKDLSDCTQQFNSSPCLVFFTRIVLYGHERDSKLYFNLLDENILLNNYSKVNSSLTKELFQTGKFSDIKIIIGTKEFHVHRCILSLSSEVFERMFLSDMIETRSNIIEINDYILLGEFRMSSIFLFNRERVL